MKDYMEMALAKDIAPDKRENLWPKSQIKRTAVLYLGLQNFHENFYESHIQFIKKIREEEKRKLAEEKEKIEGQDENEDEVEEQEEDKGEQDVVESQFLKQFPNLSVFFRMNKNLIKKSGKKKGFSINSGGWIPPTCCSMLVNVIQLQLTYTSIMLTKGNVQMFWLPELVRNDLETKFKAI